MTTRNHTRTLLREAGIILASLAMVYILTGCTFRPRNVRLILEGDGMIIEPVASAGGETAIHAMRAKPEIGRVRYMGQPVKVRIVKRQELERIGKATGTSSQPMRVAFKTCGPMADGEGE